MVNKEILHSEPRVIAGVLREAFLNGREVYLSGSGIGFWTKIKDIVEVSARDRDGRRRIIFKEQSTSLQSPEIMVPFGRYVFKGVLNATPEVSEYYFPEKLIQSTQRQFERFNISQESHWSKVTLVQKNVAVIADFIAEEIGFDSIKGVLTLPSDVRLEQSAVLVGKLQTKRADIRLNAVIVRANEIISGDEQAYSIVLKQISEKSVSNDRTIDGERRSENRYNFTYTLELKSEILSRTVSVEAFDITSTTFRGKISDSKQASAVLFGVDYQIEGQNIYFHLIDTRQDDYVFEVSASDEVSSRWWFDLYSRSVQPTVKKNNIDTIDVLKLFCEAGALSTNFIRGSQKDSQNIQKGFEDSYNIPWLHRWVEMKDGHVSGYVSALNLIKEVWFIGDLVGGQSEENKISPKFMSSFFYAFTRYMKAFKSEHTILMTWIKKHPYWEKLEKHLEENSSKVFSRCSCFYTRITGEQWAKSITKESTSSVVTEIPAVNLNYSKNFQVEILPLYLKFLNAYKSAAARSLNRELGGAVVGFQVKYLEYSIDCFYVDLPDGASINRFPQSVFVFDLNEKISGDDWVKIRNAIVQHCFVNSMYPSSIRRVSGYSDDQKFVDESASMSLYLTNPELFDDYSG